MMASDTKPGMHEFRSDVMFGEQENNRLEREGSSEARIGSQLAYMQESIAKLNAIISELQSRIEPILIPDTEENTPFDGDVPRKPSSDMSNTIDDLNSQISRVQHRIGSLVHRVQL